MSVKKRGKVWHIRHRFGGVKEVWVSTKQESQEKAKQIEHEILFAIRTGAYHELTPDARTVFQVICMNQGWRVPVSAEDLTLWQAVEMCLRSPDVEDSPNRKRLQYALAHVVKHFGKDYPVKDLWVPEIKRYQVRRLKEGASPATVNREKTSLSKVFQVLIENRVLSKNPARLVKQISERQSKRKAYVSLQDVWRVLWFSPDWYRPMLLTAYYTGMRRGEILNLKRDQIDLERRMIVLTPQDTKEHHWKRVPIPRVLLPTLVKVLSLPPAPSGKVFALQRRGTRDIDPETFKNVWKRSCQRVMYDSVSLWDLRPHFHDLRHTWKRNARKSGVRQEIERAIMGHAQAGQGIHESYDYLDDEDLIEAIDSMTYDHGITIVQGKTIRSLSALQESRQEAARAKTRAKDKKKAENHTLSRPSSLMISAT